MRDINADDIVNFPSVYSIHKLPKERLISTLKKCGLKTDVTVKEGRKLLSKFISSKRKRLSDEPSFEMDETDSVCFVCDTQISSENWKYKLLETASKKRNVPIADLIKQLVGNEFAVLVGERDVVCSNCMNLLNAMDALTAQLKTVQSALSKHLYSKYSLESESIKFQVEYDDTIAEESEPLHKCSTCSFETKYEKEFNIHIRTHIIDKPATKTTSVNLNVPISKPETVKKRGRGRPPKNPLASNIKTNTKKLKPKDITKQKKTKIVFQCSVCNKMFPNESSIRSHAKKAHGNENIVVSEESEYEDIQTLESSDEESSSIGNKKKLQDQIKKTTNSSLDFLDDWDEDEEDANKTKNSTQHHMSDIASLINTKDNYSSNEEEHSDDEQDQSAKPTCLFCNAKFMSFDSVQDHVKMVHRDRTSNLNIGLKTTPPVESFEIDSTTDIIENKNQTTIRRKSSASKIKTYKCNICGIKKVTLKFIKNHLLAHKKKLALQCKLCGTSFKNIVAVKVHRYRCHKVAGVKRKCILCNIICVDINQLKTHVKKVHSKPMIGKLKMKSKAVEREFTSNYSLRNTVDSYKLQHNLRKPSSKKVAVNTKSAHDSSKISSCEVSSTSLENGLSLPTRKKYTCSLCNFVSNSDLEMKGHVKRHSVDENRNTGKTLTRNKKNAKNISKLKCTECDVHISDPRQLVNHMNRHKANTCQELGICFYCDKLFLEREQLIVHLNTVHTFKTNPTCTICGKVYAHSKDFKLHFLKKHFSTKTEKLIKQVSEELLNETLSIKSESAAANDVYSKVYKELQDLTGEGNEDMSMDLPVTSLMFSCPLCDFGDYNKKVVENHLPSHPQHYCNICKTLFNTEEAIKHIENHSIEFQNKSCGSCEVKCHDALHLQCHSLRVHSAGKKLFKCTMCEKSFVSERHLTSHKLSMHRKTSKKVFTCEKCKMNFFTEKEFQIHREFAHRIVLNCRYCDKTLNNMKKLVLHEKNHLKQVKRIYKCNICGKVVKTLSALKVHKTVHSNNIPLKCELCSQTFKSFHNLREHSVKHSNIQEKRFFCGVCGKGFYFYDSHYRHRRIHLDPLLFKCNACGEIFPSKLKRLEHKTTCSASTQCSKCFKFYNKNVGLKSHKCLVKAYTN